MADKEVFDFDQVKMPNVSPNFVKYGIIGIFIIIFIWSSFFTISPEEVGVILRFGKFSHIADPGLNFKLPLGIDKLEKVPVQRQLKEEFGFRTESVGVRTRYSQANFLDESLMLTGDLNAAEVEWIVQYRVADPYKFLFKVRDTKSTFRAMTEAVVREIVGDRTVNEVLTIGRQEISVAVQAKLQELCNQYETGISVDQVVLQDVNPPDRVKPSFNEVNAANQEMEKMVNQAYEAYNKVIPKARGTAEKTIKQAEGYALNRINRAQGDANKFIAVYNEYRLSKDVTRRRMYIETLNEILPKIEKKYFMDKDLKSLLPMLQLNEK